MSTIQALRFERKQFRTKKDVQRWLSAHKEYKPLKKGKERIDKAVTQYRVRIRDPDLFTEDGYKTVDIGEGVSIIYGVLK